MTDEPEFTAEQLALIETPTSTYVEACPGAGKTKTIIERFTRRAQTDPRRGVALISFTNAVVDEARSRCSGQIDLVRSPNFIGTLDSFINRFVVGPLLASETGKAISFRSIWEHVPGSTITAPGVRAVTKLDWFEFDLDGTATLNHKRAPADRAGTIIALEDWQTARLAQKASDQWKRNIGRGVLDAAAARLYLMKYLNDATSRAYLLGLLRARFYEVIVDEVQDCSAEDVALLRLLHEASIRLIMVGDPDQAIYGFRGGSATDLADLVNLVDHGPRLDGNFRSSASICTAVDSLRASNSRDRATGRNSALLHPVRLMSYASPAQFKARIEPILANHSMTADDIVVLAHASAKARACAGAGSASVNSSTNRIFGLALLIHALQNESSTPRARADALTALESALQQRAGGELADLPIDEFLEQIRLSPRAYREHALRLAMALGPPFEAAPSVFKAALAASAEAQRVMAWTMNGLTLPPHDTWPSRPASLAGAYQHSTIHGYKGLQFKAVALVIPERISGVPAAEDGLSQWTSEVYGEARNVLYVGASRAEELLIVGVHASVLDEVQANFDRDQVTYQLYTA